MPEIALFFIVELIGDPRADFAFGKAVSFGNGAYAEFAGINVKSIRFTVEVPEGKESVGLAEIALVGKFAA